MFQITDAWIMLHRTERLAWTRDQFTAVGVEWPPRQGWKRRIIGTLITEEARERFEMKLDRKAARHYKTHEKPI